MVEVEVEVEEKEESMERKRGSEEREEEAVEEGAGLEGSEVVAAGVAAAVEIRLTNFFIGGDFSFFGRPLPAAFALSSTTMQRTH